MEVLPLSFCRTKYTLNGTVNSHFFNHYLFSLIVTLLCKKWHYSRDCALKRAPCSEPVISSVPGIWGFLGKKTTTTRFPSHPVAARAQHLKYFFFCIFVIGTTSVKTNAEHKEVFRVWCTSYLFFYSLSENQDWKNLSSYNWRHDCCFWKDNWGQCDRLTTSD